MGKTPERGAFRGATTAAGSGSGHGASGGLRYRRKAPASGKPDAKAVAGDDNQRESPAPAGGGKQVERGGDNQREHEQPVAVAPLARGDAGGHAREAKKLKKKLKTRPASGEKSPNGDAGSRKDVQRKTKRVAQGDKDKHERKPHARKQDKPAKWRPKQMQWKAKAQQPTARAKEDAEKPALAEAPVLTSRGEEGVTERKQATESMDEDADFAAREREFLKLRAKTLSYPMESSSQETQSGSDDDSATFIQFNHPPVPLSSISVGTGDARALAETAETSTIPETDCFPAPLPLDCVMALEPSRVHEILVRDFAFHPPTLQVDAGDVVVWCVSEETPRMVEHCLDVTLARARDAATISASTAALGAGHKFAWRFGDAGTVTIVCSVYDAHGSLVVKDTRSPTPARSLSKHQRAKSKKQKKSKHLVDVEAAAISSDPSAPEAEAAVELDGSVKDASDVVEVFHCPPELLHHDGIPDMDAGLCRAVLSQLDAVSTSAIVGVNASSGGVLPVIVVGDVECPISEDANQEADATAAVESAGGKSGADEVVDFQERVIAMLRRSEEAQAEQRRSFVVGDSAFDALRAYDFFKRRFSDLQAGCERVVYL